MNVQSTSIFSQNMYSIYIVSQNIVKYTFVTYRYATKATGNNSNVYLCKDQICFKSFHFEIILVHSSKGSILLSSKFVILRSHAIIYLLRNTGASLNR